MMSKLKWTLHPSGFGYNYHFSGDYVVEPYDLDVDAWDAFYKGDRIEVTGHGWQAARKVCQDHANEGKKDN